MKLNPTFFAYDFLYQNLIFHALRKLQTSQSVYDFFRRQKKD